MNEEQKLFLVNEFEAQLEAAVGSTDFYNADKSKRLGRCVTRRETVADLNDNYFEKLIFTCSRRVQLDNNLSQGDKIQIDRNFGESETYTLGVNDSNIFMAFECILEPVCP